MHDLQSLNDSLGRNAQSILASNQTQIQLFVPIKNTNQTIQVYLVIMMVVIIALLIIIIRLQITFNI